MINAQLLKKNNIKNNIKINIKNNKIDYKYFYL